MYDGELPTKMILSVSSVYLMILLLTSLMTFKSIFVILAGFPSRL